MIETILARGDARVGDLLLAVHRRGEAFSAWDAHFHLAAWQEELPRLGGADFLAELPLEAELPWDFVELNYTKEHLAEEYLRSRRSEPSPACGGRDCGECGGCTFGTPPARPAAWAAAAGPAAAPPAAYRRLRLHYAKRGDLRFLSHLAMMQLLERLLRRSGLLFRFSQGFHPRIRMAALPPLPVGAEGGDEVIEVAVAAPAGGVDDEAGLLSALNRPDFAFTRAEFVRGDSSFHRRLRFVDFCFTWPEAGGEQARPERGEIQALLAHEDAASFSETGLELRMDFAHQGQERFARLYRLLDPERKWTSCLKRRGAVFHDPD